ncbi:hypothetical protein QCN36_gp13 [Arthrobacter phage CastorTray]|uniref:Uncharacterized protein n=1 Tax=Arthrobacter phage CastorTray TaxID=2859632 RepID=A0AAE8BHA5_9CAUD|nr:hypothetical protein QCN36_gp13 [Arthrobacter phage CastorTray]QYC55001.1 hypothetical protein SEA_CASTORTRAY_13 [Arthrobacter phage CastorTray]
MDDVDDFLMHYGVKGMRWGKRSARPSTTPRSTERAAAKDAKEAALAKMYYGEGAGTRRKLIKTTVEARKKNDPAYAEAYDRHFGNQNMDKVTNKAVKQRKRTDRVNATVKTGKGVRHILNGNSQYANATAAILVGGALYAHKKGIDKMLLDKGKTLINSPEFKKTSGDIFDQIKNFKG